MLESAPPLEHELPLPGAAEGAVRDVDRQALGLAEHADGAATDVGPGGVADVPVELRVHHLQPAAPHEDRAATAPVDRLAGRVAVDEREVLHRQAGVVLVLAVRGGPDLRLVARVHVEDPALPGAAQGHPAAAVDHDVRTGVVADLRRLGHDDRDRGRTAVEHDLPAAGHGGDDRSRGAPGRRAVADDLVGSRGVDRVRAARCRRRRTCGDHQTDRGDQHTDERPRPGPTRVPCIHAHVVGRQTAELKPAREPFCSSRAEKNLRSRRTEQAVAPGVGLEPTTS